MGEHTFSLEEKSVTSCDLNCSTVVVVLITFLRSSHTDSWAGERSLFFALLLLLQAPISFCCCLLKLALDSAMRKGISTSIFLGGHEWSTLITILIHAELRDDHFIKCISARGARRQWNLGTKIPQILQGAQNGWEMWCSSDGLLKLSQIYSYF